MKIYLSGVVNLDVLGKLETDESCRVKPRDLNILSSYYELKGDGVQRIQSLLPKIKSFMLDSGAFSFVSGTHKGKVDWDEYVERYADFINKCGVELFFELDIDKIVGLKEVERLRGKLERMTGRKPIPVWHHWRGKESMEKLSRDYSYVAFGAFITDALPMNISMKLALWAIDVAHKNGAKIHGLGFTPTSILPKYRFDSVDSITWVYGNKVGHVAYFDIDKGVVRYKRKGENQRLRYKEAMYNNFVEWATYSVYAENYL